MKLSKKEIEFIKQQINNYDYKDIVLDLWSIGKRIERRLGCEYYVKIHDLLVNFIEEIEKHITPDIEE